jgi:3,4-dihydroxy 2-butanone 4-phosphate synthase/GTP cyclohydrolase II
MVQFDTIETALQQLQNGGYVILSDNEDRENEGDLVALADRITPETVYEMLHEANGLMCVPITIQRAHELGFTKMVEHSTDPHQTPFMTTTDGTFEATGVTTGVSAFDRAATINRIANPAAKPTDFNHPGHIIQPLYALDGGLRKRIGHTEASVDLAYLTGAEPAAVIIEVLKEDGHMARRDDLAKMAKRVNVPYITINQIIEYMDAHNIKEASDLQAAPVQG